MFPKLKYSLNPPFFLLFPYFDHSSLFSLPLYNVSTHHISLIILNLFPSSPSSHLQSLYHTNNLVSFQYFIFSSSILAFFHFPTKWRKLWCQRGLEKKPKWKEAWTLKKITPPQRGTSHTTTSYPFLIRRKRTQHKTSPLS